MELSENNKNTKDMAEKPKKVTLIYASDELKNDKDVVKAAVANDSHLEDEPVKKSSSRR